MGPGARILMIKGSYYMKNSASPMQSTTDLCGPGSWFC